MRLPLFLPGDNNALLGVVVTRIAKDVDRLLHMKEDVFWAAVETDASVVDAMDSFLRFRARSFDDSVDGAAGEGDTAGLRELDRKMFALIARLASDPSRGELLYNRWVLDVAKLLDVCVLYGPMNWEETRRIVESVFAMQGKYWNDLSEVVSPVHDALGEAVKRFLAGDDLADAERFLLDVVATLHALFTVLPAAVHVFTDTDELTTDLFGVLANAYYQTRRPVVQGYIVSLLDLLVDVRFAKPLARGAVPDVPPGCRSFGSVDDVRQAAVSLWTLFPEYVLVAEQAAAGATRAGLMDIVRAPPLDAGGDADAAGPSRPAPAAVAGGPSRGVGARRPIDERKLAQVREILPEADEDAVGDALERHGGSVEKAVEALLTFEIDADEFLRVEGKSTVRIGFSPQLDQQREAEEEALLRERTLVAGYEAMYEDEYDDSFDDPTVGVLDGDDDSDGERRKSQRTAVPGGSSMGKGKGKAGGTGKGKAKGKSTGKTKAKGRAIATKNKATSKNHDRKRQAMKKGGM